MMKMNSTWRTGIASSVIASVSLVSTQALATASGIRINNTVTIDYSVGGVNQDDKTAEAGFVVDRKIDMLVADQGDIADARPAQTNRQLVYKVTNEGNDAQKFDIDVLLDQSFSGTTLTLDTNADTLGAAEYRVYISEDAILDIPGDTVYNPTGFVLADTPTAFTDPGTTDEFHVIIVVNLPADAQNGDNVRFSVVANALNDTDDGIIAESLGNGLDDAATPANAVDIVYADGGKTTDSAGTDAAEDGKQTDNALVTVSSADLTATKTVTIVSENTQGTFTCATDADPGIDDNTQGAIPGACLEYSINVANGTGGSVQDATDISITDTLPAGVTFAGFFSTTGWTNVNEAGGVITADVDGNLAQSQSAELVIRVTVD